MKDNELLHTRYPDLFTDNEATDPALERLIADLEALYTSASLPEQLKSTLESYLDQPDTIPVEQFSASLLERTPIESLAHHRRRWPRVLSTLVAAALMTLIVGSLLLVLYQTHQPNRNRTGASSSVTGLNRFLTIHMINTSTGWAQISNSRISDFAVLRTTDGGSHWQDVTPSQLTTPVEDNPAKLYALDSTTAWVTDILPLQNPQSEKYHSILLRTTDAGRTWHNIALPRPISDASSISDVDFLNAQTGWITIVSRTGKGGGQMQYDFWHTSNGGQTWSHVTIPNFAGRPGFSSVTFVDEKTWWLIGSSPATPSAKPAIYVTHDAGSTWHKHVLSVPAGVSFSSLALRETARFFSDRDGILAVSAGDIVIYVTHDGGDTWQPTTPILRHSDSKEESYSPSTPVFADMNHGWIYEEVIPFAGMKLPTVNRLIITTDGGKHWTTLEVPMPGGQKGQTVSLDNAWPSWLNPDFVSATVGWLMGYYSPSTSDLPRTALFKTVDGGHTWTIVHYSIS